MRIFRICLTGGPCAGKTSALPMLRQHFTNLGYATMTVPEAATIMFGNGFDPRDAVTDGGAFLQSELIKLQLYLEEHWTRLIHAMGAERGVLIADRGPMDGPAFCTPEGWLAALVNHNWWPSEFMERYDGVIHLVTAADGAIAHFSNETNATRREDPDRAICLDRALQTAWCGHPRFAVIDNSTNFAEKLQRTVLSAHRMVMLAAQSDSEKEPDHAV